MGGAVEVSRLVKAYGSLRAVDGLDLSVRPGEVFSLLGPNGAGKTTTVEILEGLRRPTSGTVEVLGRDPWTEMDAIRARIGVIPQEFHFFPRLSPREAIRLYARLFDRKVDEEALLATVELLDKADAMYDTLSGGQHQKVGMALALVNDPELCFLDEPTTGLDPRARRSIWAVVRRLRAEGRTVFLTTHYLDEAQQLADRIAILDHGRVVAAGRPDEIIGRYGRPERLRLIGDGGLESKLRPLGLPMVPVPGGVEITLGEKADALAILNAVASSGLAWESFSTVSDTLEDVFIRLVGREEDGGVRPAADDPGAGR
ncbi:MAG TPA: ABC transporter ATP-binding protein [Thermoplasmata archaeon]|nr:ABC transporter ATP-binding protein [Thermoplasmata archaeon]